MKELDYRQDINTIREQYQPAWYHLIEICCIDYNKLSREQRVWFNIEPLLYYGLWDHYMNNNADRNTDTIEDLKFINFHSIAKQLEDFNLLFFPQGVPKNVNERAKIFNELPDDILKNYIDEMDGKFWEVRDELEIALLEHIKNTGIGEIPKSNQPHA